MCFVALSTPTFSVTGSSIYKISGLLLDNFPIGVIPCAVYANDNPFPCDITAILSASGDIGIRHGNTSLSNVSYTVYAVYITN